MANPLVPSLSAPSSSQQITTLYRQNVSSFLFVSDSSLSKLHKHTQHHYTASTHKNNYDSLTSWIGDTARSLSLRAATPLAHDCDNNGTGDTSGSNRKKKNAKKSSKNGKVVSAEDIVQSLPSSNWSDYICMSCGTLLFPPVLPPSIATHGSNKHNDFNNDSNIQQTIQPLPSNIYIRPLKRSRTRRRRASRTKAKELHNRSLSIQRRGTSNAINTQLQKDSLLKEKIQKVAASYRLGDGRAKNCLVMKCTYCGTKRKRKGVEVKPDARSNSTRGSDGGKAVAQVSNQNANQKKRNEATKHNYTKTRVETQIHDNSDYISLSSIGGGITGKRKHNDEHTSPLLLAGKKKKKKKKPVEKKGDLMDFLSSLND